MTATSWLMRVRGLGIAAATALAVGAVPLAASPAAGVGPGSPAKPVPAGWETPRPSADQDPGQIVDESGAIGKMRVVAVLNDNGAPVVDTTSVDGRAQATDAIADLQADSRLVAVEVDQREYSIEAVGPEDSAVQVSNDTRRSEQWALDRLSAESTWSVNTGSGVKVAVVDTGVSAHTDLAGAFVTGTDTTSAGGSGRNDGNGHGTHVAGTIAATANNSTGVAGLSPDVSIIPVKVLSDSGSGYNSWVANGITWAATHGADVISMSLGGGYSDTVAVAVAYAIDQGITVVAAAGNSRTSGSPVSYPGALPGVVGVAATDSSDNYAYFSNEGDYVDIAAPGVSVLSTYPTNSYRSLSGTSMATPHVSAVAALIRSRAAAISVSVPVDTVLTSTADDLGPAGWDNDFGYGLVDPLGALAAVGSPGSPPASPVSVQASATGSASAHVSWAAGDAGTVLQYVATTAPGSKTCRSTASVLSCDLSGLSPSTQYTVTVVAKNLAGTSAASAPSAAFTTSARTDAAGDTFAAATAMPASHTVNEVIDVAADKDYWSFETATAGVVRVALTNLPNDDDLAVFNSGGAYLGVSQNWNTTDDVVSISLPAGRYVAKVYPYSGYDASNPYRLTVTVTVPAPAPPASPPKPPAAQPPAPAPPPANPWHPAPPAQGVVPAAPAYAPAAPAVIRPNVKAVTVRSVAPGSVLTIRQPGRIPVTVVAKKGGTVKVKLPAKAKRGQTIKITVARPAGSLTVIKIKVK